MSDTMDGISFAFLVQIAAPLSLAQVPPSIRLTFMGKETELHTYPPYPERGSAAVLPERSTVYRFSAKTRELSQAELTSEQSSFSLRVSHVTGRLDTRFGFPHPGVSPASSADIAILVCGLPGLLVGALPVATYSIIRAITDKVTGLTAYDRTLLAAIRKVVIPEDYDHIEDAFRLRYAAMIENSKPLSVDAAKFILEGCRYEDVTMEQGYHHEDRANKFDRYWLDEDGIVIAHFRSAFYPEGSDKTVHPEYGSLEVHGSTFTGSGATAMSKLGKERISNSYCKRPPCECCEKRES